MKAFLMRWLPALIIVYMARKMEKLTELELRAQVLYKNKIAVRKRITKKQVIVGMVGLVGSGKSVVANYLASLIGATVVCEDEIRLELQKQGAGYDHARLIGENIVEQVIKHGGNLTLDSDFVDKNKRESLRQLAKKAGVQLFFVRTVCDIDVMSQRIRENDAGEFFNSAGTKSVSKDHGKDVKFREMMRRLPQHYNWENADGGRLTPKMMNFVSFAPIDTASEDWQTNVESIAVSIIHENKTGS